MKPRVEPEHSLRRLFAGLTEQIFQVDIGICDPALTDYLGDLLSDFVHVDRIYRLRSVDGDALREISRMEAEAALGPEISGPRRQRLVNKYIGDFTLFWTGVYPENLRARRHGGIDMLEPYLVQGKRSYDIAGQLTRDGEQPPADLLRQLSVQFEYCVHGLHLVRAAWERLAHGEGRN